MGKHWAVVAVGLGIFVIGCGGRTADIGDPPRREPTTPTTPTDPSYPPSCGDFVGCDPPSKPTTPAPPTKPSPSDPDPTSIGLPPSKDVPCGPGQTAEMSFPLSATMMQYGASDPSGGGWCTGTVQFSTDPTPQMIWYSDYTANGSSGLVTAKENGASICTEPKGPDAFHCSTLVYASGKRRDQFCTIFALCENGLARATAYTW